MRFRIPLASFLILVAVLMSPIAQAVDTIVVDGGTRYQTMNGWEAHARSWEIDKINDTYDATWPVHAQAIADRMVNELGVNRIQLPIRSGWENPVDYWTPYVNHQISYNTMRLHSYEKINDNGDPSSVNANGFQFAEFDWRVETMLLPMQQLLADRGEKLYVNVVFVDFGSVGGYLTGSMDLAANPAEYAEFVQVYLDRLRTKYGVTADALEIVNEPENTDRWRGAETGQALVAVANRLSAAGYPNLSYIAPSVASAGNALPYMNALASIPGALSKLTTLSYHRYGTGDFNAIRSYAQAHNLQTSMSEFFNGTVDQLIEDLTVSNVSSWQKWAIADRTGRTNPQAFYYLADLSNAAGPVFKMAPNTAQMAQYFRYVRAGAVRVSAQSSVTARQPVAFVNANGGYVVVVKTKAGTGAQPVTVSGLPNGTYGVTVTDNSDQATVLPDATAAGGSVTLTLPEGVTTIYARSSSTPPGVPGNATVNSNPYGPLSVQGGTLAGTSITALQPDAVIVLGTTPGNPGSAVAIDFQGFNLGLGTTLTLRSGAPGQTVYLQNVDGTASWLAGMLRAESGNGAPPPALYLHNPGGIAVPAGGAITSPSGLTLDTLAGTFNTGQGLDNAGELDGGRALEVAAGAIHGSGSFRGDVITLRTFGKANNPVNGAHFLSNGLRLLPSTGSDVSLTLNAYGAAPQVLNLQVLANVRAWMPSAWPAGSPFPRNNPVVAPNETRLAGVAEPAYGGGSLILHASGSLTLVDGGTQDFTFPGSIVLKAGNYLDLNGISVNQGWTTTGKEFQGIFFEAPSIVGPPGGVDVYTNDLNWINFSSVPRAPVRSHALARASDGRSFFIGADATTPHLNVFSVLTEAAANGECYVCLINVQPINVVSP